MLDLGVVNKRIIINNNHKVNIKFFFLYFNIFLLVLVPKHRQIKNIFM